jgi:nitroimidazol reductase NimA-like FMN-containing flavoprotein (pyridoxamine 5'-phosphate oxidase superfamily)
MTLKTERTRIKRGNKRGTYDRDKINAILDSVHFCHIGYLRDGMPFVTPTLQWRDGDYVYWHGSSASSTIRGGRGLPVCVTVAAMDGIVLARSAFNHSVNYRTVMLLGEAEPVIDPDAKAAALKSMIDVMFPGRWETLRPMSATEIKATGVLRLKITEASCKIRNGGPIDEDEDYALPIWGGEIPLQTRMATPIPDPRNLPGVKAPAHIADIVLGKSAT